MSSAKSSDPDFPPPQDAPGIKIHPGRSHTLIIHPIMHSQRVTEAQLKLSYIFFFLHEGAQTGKDLGSRGSRTIKVYKKWTCGSARSRFLQNPSDPKEGTDALHSTQGQPRNAWPGINLHREICLSTSTSGKGELLHLIKVY